jgi:hypothetical protein
MSIRMSSEERHAISEMLPTFIHGQGEVDHSQRTGA